MCTLIEVFHRNVNVDICPEHISGRKVIVLLINQDNVSENGLYYPSGGALHRINL